MLRRCCSPDPSCSTDNPEPRDQPPGHRRCTSTRWPTRDMAVLARRPRRRPARPAREAALVAASRGDPAVRRRDGALADRPGPRRAARRAVRARRSPASTSTRSGPGVPPGADRCPARRADRRPSAACVDRASVLGHVVRARRRSWRCAPTIDGPRRRAGLRWSGSSSSRSEADRFSSEVGHYRFVQGAVRQVAYGRPSRAATARPAHLAVAGLLEDGDDGARRVGAVIAQHYLEADRRGAGRPDVAELRGWPSSTWAGPLIGRPRSPRPARPPTT